MKGKGNHQSIWDAVSVLGDSPCRIRLRRYTRRRTCTHGKRFPLFRSASRSSGLSVVARSVLASLLRSPHLGGDCSPLRVRCALALPHTRLLLRPLLGGATRAPWVACAVFKVHPLGLSGRGSGWDVPSDDASISHGMSHCQPLFSIFFAWGVPSPSVGMTHSICHFKGGTLHFYFGRVSILPPPQKCNRRDFFN